MDPFDKKREVVHQLLSMLKKHAADEVGSGLAKPEGMPEDAGKGIQVERVEMAAHDMDHPTPEHDVETKELSHGGMVEDVNKGGYPAAPEKAIPYESAEGHPDKEGAAEEEAAEPLAEREAEIPEEDAHPAFAEFFGKKRKK